MYAKMVLSAVLLGAAALAHALEVKPYSAQALAAAQKADQPVAIQFHADWCPTCKAQDKVLQSLKAEPGLGVTLLIANYDTEKALKKRFNVRAQSTIVALHGKQERARLVGETSEDSIRKVLRAAL
jgi:thioredoxin-like negative regulator of GroEL